MSRYLFHLTSGLFKQVKLPQCGLQLRALLIAVPGDIVLLHERGITLDAVRSELDLFARMGIGPDPCDVYLICGNTITNVDTDKELTVREVRALVLGKKFEVFAEVSCDGLLYSLAQQFGFRIDGPKPTDSRRANDKARFQELACEGVFTIPAGEVVSRAHVSDTVERMLQTHSAVYVKPTEAATGQGHQDPIKKLADLEVLDVRFQTWIVQQCVPKTFDGSYQFVMRGGRIVSLELTGQYVEHGHHDGNFSLNGAIPEWLDLDTRDRVRELLETHYADMRNGAGSVDVIFHLNRKCIEMSCSWLLEVNWRRTAPSYVIEFMRCLFGEPLVFDMKGFWIPTNCSDGTLVGTFGELLYTPGARQGFIPFCLLPQHNFCYGFTFAESIVARDQLLAKVCARQAELAASVA